MPGRTLKVDGFGPVGVKFAGGGGACGIGAGGGGGGCVTTGGGGGCTIVGCGGGGGGAPICTMCLFAATHPHGPPMAQLEQHDATPV